MNSVTKRRIGAVVGALGMAGTLALIATPANAMPGSNDQVNPSVSGDRRCIAAETVYLRNWPAGQAWTQMYHNQTFSVYEYRDSGWARGYAWGHVNSDKSPYAPPQDNIWIISSALGARVNDGSPCP
ncbi:MAG: hypothetical protein WCA46_02610 [Actinocatenispora sp.]